MSNIIHVEPNDLPPNQPVVGMDDVGKGWRRVSVGEKVKTYYQAYMLAPGTPGWRLSSFYTSEQFINQGRSHYRAPASLKAWLTILFPLIRKWFRGLFSADS